MKNPQSNQMVPASFITADQYHKDFTTVRDSLLRIEKSIVGDEDFGQKGIIGRLDSLETRNSLVDAQERKTIRKILIYILTAAGGGGLLNLVWQKIVTAP